MAKRAFIIAIENYEQMQEGLNKSLPDTHKHALEFRKWLIDSLGVKAEDIFFCTEDATLEGRTAGATRPAIKAELKRLRDAAQDSPEDLFFYFSGHGFCYVDIDDIPTADVLLTADYAKRDESSDACLKLDEIQKWLRMCLGVASPGGTAPAPGHYYFIDACRNTVSERDIKVGPLGLPYQISVKKKPPVYTLYSTTTGTLAAADESFPTVLIDGLNGRGRAKRWYQGALAVLFDSLRAYIEQRLQIELDQRIDGGRDGVIRTLAQPMEYTCAITVDNAGAADTFNVEVTNDRKQVVQQFTFSGPQRSFNAAPDDYYVRVQLSSPPADTHAVADTVIPASPVFADLYDNCTLKYAKQPPAPPPPDQPRSRGIERPGAARDLTGEELGVPPVPPPPAPRGARGSLSVFAPFGAEVTVRDAAKHIVSTAGAIDTVDADVAPGRYVVETRDARGVTVDRRQLTVTPGAQTIDLRQFQTSPLRDTLRMAIQGNHVGGAVDFSESLGPTPDQGLDLWLALMGAARITGGADDYSKLSPLPLATFDQVVQGDAPIYVLAGFERPDVDFRARLSADWRGGLLLPVPPHPQFPGLFELVERASQPAYRYLTLQIDGAVPVTVGVCSLANRATLVTVSRESTGTVRIQQFMFALKALEQYLPQRGGLWPANDPWTPELAQVSAPLRLARRCVEVQRAFAQSQQLDEVLSTQELEFLLYFKWFEPIVALLAAYELVRRGEMQSLPTVVNNLRAFFGNLPDTDALARLAGLPWTLPAAPPLLLEGFQALDLMAGDPGIPPGESLLFRGPWTMWRGLDR